MLELLWAKKRDDKWLPLTMHLSDTVAVMEYLWDKWLPVSSKTDFCKAFKTKLTLDQAKQVMIFVAAAHDVGKATPVFQSKICGKTQCEADRAIESSLKSAEIPLKDSFVTNLYHTEAGYELLMEAGCDKTVSSVIGSHHGSVIADHPVAIKKNKECYYLEDVGKEKWERIQREALKYSLKLSGWTSLKDIPAVEFDAQVWMTGILIMADWIASNEEYFPLIPVNLNEKTYSSKERLKSANLCFLKGGWENKVNNLINSDDFIAEFGFTPNEIQTATLDISQKITEPGIIVLEAQMGKGKTEAALAACDVLASKFGKKGIFFALPSQATSDGMFERVKGFLEKDDSKGSIRLVHGKAAFNENYMSLPKIDVTWDEEDNGSLGIGEWFTGRKTALLADFVVGTVDQVLMAGLQQKHVMLRHLGLANKVVVVDEVHAYDSYMNTYLKRALSWLGAYHVPVVLLSATLPYHKKIDLVKAYIGENKGIDFSIPEYTDQYPRITYSDGQDIRIKAIENKDRSKEVKVSFEEIDLNGIAKKICAKLESGEGCIGVILNTVKRTQELYAILKNMLPGIEILLIHSGFLAKDRIGIEENIRKKLGKPVQNPYRPEKCIVIGSQVLEQSLDIDFDWLITDHCPIDLLLQRIGRLQRHNRIRPEQFLKPECLVAKPDSKSKDPSELIYGKYLLKRTEQVAPETIIIPDDLSHLVTEVYDNEEKNDADYERWNDQLQQKEQKAEQYLIHYPIDRNKFDYKMSYLMKNGIADTSTKGEARVRDTNGSVEVVIYQKCDDGDRIISTGERINMAMIKELSAETIRLPYTLSNIGIIDKTIEALEGLKETISPDFKENVWLKNTLLLPLDRNLSVKLQVEGKIYNICYSKETGIKVEKESEQYDCT